jgi:hypothetical protein
MTGQILNLIVETFIFITSLNPSTSGKQET